MIQVGGRNFVIFALIEAEPRMQVKNKVAGRGFESRQPIVASCAHTLKYYF
jgi:hypothetical protein